MKKFKFLLLITSFFVFVSCSSYKVHSVAERTKEPVKNGVVYALPQTVLKIDIVVERIEDLRGPYADFANLLIGANNIITDDEVTYDLHDIRFSTYSEPDPKAYFYIEPKKNIPNIVTLPDGIIQSINLNEQPLAKSDNIKKADIQLQNPSEKTFLEPTGSFNYIERLDTIYTPIVTDSNEVTYEKSFITVAAEKPVGDRAKEAAEQMLQIRMKKKELIYGEYEDQYSKNAIDYIYQNLDKMEQELLPLFTGKTISTFETKSFFIVPDRSLLIGDEQPFILCSFSPDKGIIPIEDEDGVLIHASLRCEQDLYVLNNFLKKKHNKYNKNGKLIKRKKDESKGFVYRIPDNGLITVRYGSRNFSEKIVINQYGTLVKLPEKNLSVKFDTETGNVLYVKPFGKNN